MMKKRYEITGVKLSLEVIEDMIKNIKFPMEVEADYTIYQNQPVIKIPGQRNRNEHYNNRALLYLFKHNIIHPDSFEIEQKTKRLKHLDFSKAELKDLLMEAQAMPLYGDIEKIRQDIQIKINLMEEEMKQLSLDLFKYKTQETINRI